MASALLSVLLFAAVAGMLFASPRPAQAQGIPVGDSILESDVIARNVKNTLSQTLVEAAVTSVVNGVNYFTTQIAYQAAVALTTSCNGQTVCWDSKSFKDGFSQAWRGAIGEAVGTLSQQSGLTAMGFNLCAPGKAISLLIQLGMLDELKPPPPKCDYTALTNNWDNFKDSLAPDQLLNSLKPTFQPGQAPLSASLRILDGMVAIKETAKRDAMMKKLMNASAGGGFDDIRDSTSGRVKAPASVTHDEFVRMRKMQQDNPQQYSASYAAGQIAYGAVTSVVINTVQTFAQTLVARMWNRLVKGLLSTEELIAAQPDLVLDPDTLLNPPGVTGLEPALISRSQSPKIRDAGLTDPLLNFTSCPTDGRAPDNCVMDQQFANAVRVAGLNSYTVREAIKQGLLHGDWPLISANDQPKNQDPFCYTYGYCESNLKKLRAARVISIGWEIAASQSPVDKPFSLKQVVDEFNNCNDQGAADDQHRFCKMIDPDWVLTVPLTQCRAMGYGEQLISSEVSTRSEICLDKQTCLKQDDAGNCIGGWGYCSKERNIWRFNGDSCPAQFNTCRVLTARTGGTRSYNLNTIDHGVCTADNVGCRSYSTSLNAISCSCGLNGCKDSNGVAVAGTCSDAKGCSCSVTTASCTVVRGDSSCTVADTGKVCRLLLACENATCPCTASVTCTVKNGDKSCSSVTGTEADSGDDWLLDPKRYFNQKAQTCDVSSAGCTALVRLATNQSLNLIRNGSFEQLEDGDNNGNDDHAKYWTPFATVPAASFGSIIADSSKSTTGSNAILVNGARAFGGGTNDCSGSLCTADDGCPCTAGGLSCKIVKGMTKCTLNQNIIQTDIRVRGNATYTLSFNVTPVGAGADAGATAKVSFTDFLGNPISLAAADAVSTITYAGQDPTTVPTGTCDVTGGNLEFTFSATKNSEVAAVRGSCTFVVLKGIAGATLQFLASGPGAYVDDVQLEEGGGTSYHDGYGDTGGIVDARMPPDYLGCTGDDSDRPECDAFAGVCRESEVGCDGYTPTNGDPRIPAITSPQDFCPAECVGYDVFKQAASDFDQEKFPVAFIPSTAKECSEAEAGCSEFTNIDTEAVSYYAHLRMCVKSDDPSVKVYYSWEGSDTTGYQLHVWNLKQTTAAVDQGTPAELAALPSPTAADVCADAACANAGVAPCTKLDANAQNCDSKDTGNAGGSTVGYCSRADIDAGNFDCREFYDADGNRHYRLLSKTIIASAQCFQYRITTSTPTDCANSSGRWDTDKGQCIYNADVGQSISCAAEQNNCRAYKGNAATNVHTLLSDDFEGGVKKWTDSTDVSANGLAQSPESVTVGGHSLKVLLGGGVNRIAGTEVGGMVASARSYSLSFWARGTGSVSASLRDAVVDAICTLPASCDAADGCECTTETGMKCTVQKGNANCTIAKGSNPAQKFAPDALLSSEWKRFTLGPIIGPSTAGWGTTPTKFELSVNGICSNKPKACTTATAAADCGAGTCLQSDVFVDNVQVKEVQDNIYVVRDSWKTPVSCDSTAVGSPSPQEMLGCKEYATSKGDKVDLRSFSRLCREKAIGCSAYSDTRNTPDNPYAESFNAVCELKRDDGTTPRRCGYVRCTGPAGNCNTSFDGKAYGCTITAGSAFCDAPMAPDAGASCVCNYNIHHPAASATAPVFLPEVCRVAVGESQCRFKLDHFDTSTREDQNPDRVNVETDRRVYLVARNAAMCAANQIGCTSLGQAKLTYEAVCQYKNAPTNNKCGLKACAKSGKACTANGDCAANDVCAPTTCSCSIGNATCRVNFGEGSCTLAYERPLVGKWGASVVKDLPAQYGDILCKQEADGCDAYSSSDGIQYFKDPADHVCMYKEGVAYQNQTVNGWFRKSDSGQNFPCYPELRKNGDTFEIYKNADSVCQSTTCSNPDGCDCYLPGVAAPACRIPSGGTICGYQGWVGQCESQYDRCQEFADPSVTSNVNPTGYPYYYIKNGRLDLQSCAGSVSLKQGCVAFKQTSDPSNLYSAATSYYKSKRDAQNGKVSPVNCDLAQHDPACDYRCMSVPAGHCSVTQKYDCRADSDCQRCSNNEAITCTSNGDCGGGTCSAPGQTCVGVKKYTSACQINTDCNAALGETCVQIGTVANPVSPGNDANVIIHVSPDRECSEWLACTTYSTAWDASKGQYRKICSGFGPCTENKKLGQVFDCVSPQTAPKTVLTATEYSKRDVSWGGYEYSGYTIPGRFSPTFLMPLSIVKGVCMKPGSPPTPVPNTTCVNTSDCGAGNYCKQLSGVCQNSTNDWTSCTGDSECGGKAAYCSYNFLNTHRYATVLDQDRSCKGDADCSGNATGYRDEFGNPMDGACIDKHCAYNPGGGKFNAADLNWAPRCRAYPEADSPYGPSVLDSASAGNEGGYDRFGQAKVKKGAFSGANVCGNGNDCACSYSKWVYGKGSDGERFLTYSASTTTGPVTFLGSGGAHKMTTDITEGICVGGDREGEWCDPSRPIVTQEMSENIKAGNNTLYDPCDQTGGGRCQKLSQVSYQQGWQGFCLDLDKSLNVGGDKAKFDCNLWMPVDQLEGAPDNNNQHEEAGFNPPNSELLYCNTAQGLGYGVPSDHSGIYDFLIVNEDLNGMGHLISQIDPPSPTAGIITVATAASVAYVAGPVAGFLVGIIGGLLFGPDEHQTRTMDIKTYMPSGPDLYEDQIAAMRVLIHQWNMKGSPGEEPAYFMYLTPQNHWNNWVLYAEDAFPTSDKSGFRLGYDGKEPDSCDNNNDGGDAAKNWNCNAIHANFDPVTHKLLGFTGTIVDNDNRKRKLTAPVQITALMRENCLQLSQVHSNVTTPRNIAWTDVLYQSQQGKDDILGYNMLYKHNTSRTNSVPPNAELKPYGNAISSNLMTSGKDNIDLKHPVSLWWTEGGSGYTFYNYTGSAQDRQESGDETKVHFDGKNNRASDNSDVPDVGGYPYACWGPCGVGASSKLWPQNAYDIGQDKLSKFFVTSWRKFTYAPAQAPGTVYKPENGLDNRLKYAGSGEAPRIASVNRFNCSSDVPGMCEEGTEGLTVNTSQASNVIPQQKGKFKASIYFYAWADKNRLPLRRVIVDFGDDTTRAGQSGAYLNHRGCVGTGCGSPANPICEANNEWGKTKQTCESHYFEYSHTYICTPDMITGPGKFDACDPGNPRFPCQDGVACHFRPRVQVMDNWGFCNGNCKGITKSGGRCFNMGNAQTAPDKIQEFLNSIYVTTGDDVDPATCNVGQPNAVNECWTLSNKCYSVKVNGAQEKAWTEYAGDIILQPEQ